LCVSARQEVYDCQNVYTVLQFAVRLCALTLQIPTMIVYGTEDKQLGLQSVGNLRNMPNSEIMPMEGAGHANYEQKPEEWHRLLYNFLLAVEQRRQ